MSNFGSPRVTVEAAPAYELVLSLAVAVDTPSTEIGGALQRAAGPALLRRVRAVSTGSWMWAHVLSVAAEAPAPRDVAAFRAYLERMPALELQRRLVGYYVRWFRRATAVDVMDAAIRGERAAVRTFLRTSYPEDERWQEALRARLDAGAAQAKRELVAIVAEWEESVFPQLVEPTLRDLATAAAAMRRALRTGAGRTSEVLGWEYVPEPGITRVLVVPSFVIRPHDHQFEHEQLKLLCVPIEPRQRALAEGGADLLAFARALGQEDRLRLVLALAERDLPAQELAERTGSGLTTTLHHLAVLRASGIVTDGGRRKPYRLSRERIEGVASFLATAVRSRVTPTGRPSSGGARPE